MTKGSDKERGTTRYIACQLPEEIGLERRRLKIEYQGGLQRRLPLCDGIELCRGEDQERKGHDPNGSKDRVRQSEAKNFSGPGIERVPYQGPGS